MSPGWTDGAVNIQAPVEFTGLPDGVAARTSLLSLEIGSGIGERFATAEVNRYYVRPTRPRAWG